MQRSDSSKAFPFSVSTTQCSRSLIRIYQRLMGELAKHEAGSEVMLEPEEVRQRMSQIEAVLSFLDANFDPTKLKPRRDLPKIGPLGYGQVRSGVLAALKRAGDWQTASQLADAVLAHHRITLTPAQRRHFLQKLRQATHALHHQGAVVRERDIKFGQTAVEQRWKLSSMFD